MKRVLMVLAIPALVLGTVGAQQQAQQQHAAAVLVQTFETVGSTKTDFLIDSESRTHTHFIPSENSLRWPYMHWLGGLHHMTDTPGGAAATIEKSYGTLLVGAKDFHIPHTYGTSMRTGFFNSHATYIAVLDEGAAQPDLTSVFLKADYQTIQGKQVWTWTLPPFEGHPDPTTFYAEQVGGSYFVLSNNEPDFEEVLTALAGQAPVPENWATLSAHPYWVYRNVDPNSKNQIDLRKDVVSITFTTDLADGAKGGSFAVHALSGDLTMSTEPNVVTAGGLKPGEKGNWDGRFKFPMDHSNPPLERFMYVVGFGVLP